MARENFYLILELPFDPPEERNAVIEQAIERKRLEWSKGTTDFKKGLVYRNYMTLLPEIRSVMLNPQKRKAEYEEARNLMVEKIKRMLTIVAKRGYLYEAEVRNMAKKCNVDVAFVKKVCQIKIVPDQVTKEEVGKPEAADRFKVYEVYLKALNKRDYYDFLNYTGRMERISEMPVIRLQQLVKKRRVVIQKNTPEESAIQKLCADCEKTFRTEEGKREYDAYLLYKKVQEIYMDIEVATQVTKILDAAQGKEAMNQLQSVLGDVERCRRLLQTYCRENGILWEDKEKQKEKAKVPKRVEPIVSKELEARLAKVKEAMEEKQYYHAQQALQATKRVFPTVQVEELEEKIMLTIEQTERFMREAKLASGEEQVIASTVKAANLCKDHPEIERLLSKFPPKLSGEVEVIAEPDNRRNVLRWMAGNRDSFVRYAIVRKRGGIPQSINDGELLATVATTIYYDITIYPATLYYYTVFATRMGMYSKGIHSTRGCMNLFEVQGVRLQAKDKEIEVSWEEIPTGAYVEVYRQQEGRAERKKVETITTNGFVDSMLVNDCSYLYQIYAVYPIGGKKEYANPILVKGSPCAPPEPITNLTVEESEGWNEFILRWENKGNTVIEFYYQYEMPTYTLGQVLSSEDLVKDGKRLLIRAVSKTSGTFTLEEGKIYYIYGVTKRNRVAVMGTVVTAINLKGISIKECVCNYDTLHMYCDWPANVKYMDILYRMDQYPQGINDHLAKRIRVTKQLYEQTKTLRIDQLVKAPYYFKVYGEISLKDTIYYTKGTNVFFNNIEKYKILYSIHVKRFLFKPRKIEVTFEAKDESFVLPEIMLVIAKGYPPAFRHSGTQVAQLPTMNISRSYTYSILWNEFGDNMYLKAFLKNKEDEVNYELQLKYGAKSKLE